jgi:phenylpropionate dioxygenase-like ring-hydroxylating dioxygenase large terminal subunit
VIRSSRAFTSREFFQLEADAVFSAGWTSVGFASDASEPGDAHPLAILGGIPLVIVRDANGVLRVFHNV